MNYQIITIQIIISILLITSIMLQPKSGGLGSAFGSQTQQHTKRGFEKVLFNFTIILGIAFVISSLASIFLA